MKSDSEGKQEGAGRSRWTLITNHGALLVFLDTHPDCTVEEISAKLRLSPRTVLRLLQDLTLGGYVRISKKGRRNSYEVLSGLVRGPGSVSIPAEPFLGAFKP